MMIRLPSGGCGCGCSGECSDDGLGRMLPYPAGEMAFARQYAEPGTRIFPISPGGAESRSSMYAMSQDRSRWAVSGLGALGFAPAGDLASDGSVWWPLPGVPMWPTLIAAGAVLWWVFAPRGASRAERFVRRRRRLATA